MVPGKEDQLLDLAFLVQNVLTYYWIVLHDLHLAWSSTTILSSSIEMTGTC